MFKYSHAYNVLNAMNGGREYLLGDNAYPLWDSLLVPFKMERTQREKEFNKQLSSIRIRVEHSFGALKKRFPQLKELRFTDMNLLISCVEACVLIHNFLITNQVPLEDADDLSSSEDELDSDDSDSEQERELNSNDIYTGLAGNSHKSQCGKALRSWLCSSIV